MFVFVDKSFLDIFFTEETKYYETISMTQILIGEDMR